MVGPIPKPDNYKEKHEDKVNSTKDKYIKQPGYQYPIKYDYFDKLKSGSALMSHPAGKVIVDCFGCKTCRWVNSDLCPHKGDVTHLKPHANRICSQRLSVPLMLHEEGIYMTGKQMLQVRGYMDADFFSKYVQDKALEEKRDINDVFAWEKLKADILDKMRKQDEGSKLQVVRKVTPSDLANLIDQAKSVDAIVSDIQTTSNDLTDMDYDSDVVIDFNDNNNDEDEINNG